MEIYRKKDIPWRIIDNQALVVNPKTSLIYPLNVTACQIWQLLDGVKNIKEIAEIIYNEFEADKETIQSDVLSFISQLKDAGLIEKI